MIVYSRVKAIGKSVVMFSAIDETLIHSDGVWHYIACNGTSAVTVKTSLEDPLENASRLTEFCVRAPTRICEIIFRMAPLSPPYLRAGPYWVTGRSSQRNVPIRAWYWSELFRPRYKSSQRPGFLRTLPAQIEKKITEGRETAHRNASKEAVVPRVISVTTYRIVLHSSCSISSTYFDIFLKRFSSEMFLRMKGNHYLTGSCISVQRICLYTMEKYTYVIRIALVDIYVKQIIRNSWTHSLKLNQKMNEGWFNCVTALFTAEYILH